MQNGLVTHRSLRLGCIAVAIVALARPVSLLAQASVCGNGVVETGEECDDGNTVAGDGCSSTCTIELSAGCVLIAQTDYEAAHGGSVEFQRVRGYAEHLGYEDTMGLVARCSDTSRTMYIALVFKQGDHSTWGYLVTRDEFPEGDLQTVFGYRLSPTQVAVATLGGSIVIADHPGYDLPNVTAVDSDGNPLP